MKFHSDLPSVFCFILSTFMLSSNVAGQNNNKLISLKTATLNNNPSQKQSFYNEIYDERIKVIDVCWPSDRIIMWLPNNTTYVLAYKTSD